MTLRKWTEEVEITPQLAAGTTYNVELRKLQQVRDGRPVHLLALELEVAMQYDVANNPSAALPGPYVRSVLDNIVLRSGDHRWVDALDGDELQLLGELRRGNALPSRTLDINAPALVNDAAADTTYGAEELALLGDLTDAVNALRAAVLEMERDIVALQLGTPGDPEDIPAANDADASRTVILRYVCHGLGSSPWDGAIPLALLDESKGANGLSFRVAKGFKGSADYTIDHATVKVRAVLCTRDELRFPTPHTMRAWDEARSDFHVTPEGRVLSLLVRDVATQAGAIVAPNHSNYDGITITIDNEVIQHSRSVAELVSELNERARPWERLFPTGPAPFLPISIARGGEKRTSLHSGTFRVEIKTRKDAANQTLTKSRVLLHETGRHNSPSIANQKRIVGAPVAGTLIEPRFTEKGARGPEHPIADVIDQAAYWPGIFARVPAQKLALKKAGKR